MAAATSSISNILDLIKSTSGQKSTTTKSSSIDQTAYDAMLKNILSGVNGLATVSSGQRSAGLYNSSTNQLLTNDLVTRAAGEVAANNKSETTTQVVSPAVKASSIAKGIGGLQIASQALDLNKKLKLTDKIGSLFDSSGAGEGSGSSLLSGDTAGTFGVLSGSNDSSYLSSLGNDYGSGLGNLLNLSTTASTASDAISTADTASSSGGSILDAISGAWDSFKGWAGFANGGKVPSWESLYTPEALATPVSPTYDTSKSGSRIQKVPQAASSDMTISKGSSDAGLAGAQATTATPGYGISPASMVSLGLHAISLNPAGIVSDIANMYSENTYGKNALAAMYDAVFNPGMNKTVQDLQTDYATAVSAANMQDFVGPLSPAQTTAIGIDVGQNPAIGQTQQSVDVSSAYGLNSSGSGSTGGSFGGMNGWAGGDSGSSGGTGTAANGAKIPGHDLAGKDNIPIRVSAGEVVLPTDVVDAVESHHPGFFDALMAEFHTPIRK